MSRLDDLYGDISTLTVEELTERLRTVRADRVVRKARKTTKKPQRRATGDKLKAMLAAMTPEERASLLKGLKK